MKIKLILLFLTICLFTSLSFAANKIFHYDPEQVTLTGIIKVKKFPAPPKNERIGDKAETYRYLVLDRPIDVFPQKNDSAANNELQKNVKDLQIVRLEDCDDFDTWVCERCRQQNQFSKNKKCEQCSNSNWSDSLIGKRVRITGKLYSRVVRIVMIANHFEGTKEK